MSEKGEKFDLFPEEFSSLLDIWSKGRGGYESNNSILLIDILKKLSMESFEQSKDPKNTPDSKKIADKLSNSSGYMAEILEHGLEEAIDGFLECQRRTPDKLRKDIAEDLVFRFKLIATDCFIAGITAVKFNQMARNQKIVNDRHKNSGKQQMLEHAWLLYNETYKPKLQKNKPEYKKSAEEISKRAEFWLIENGEKKPKVAVDTIRRFLSKKDRSKIG